MEIQICSIVIEHAPEVQQLSEQLGYPLSISEVEENIKEVMKAKDHTAYVAINHKKVVGWVHGFKCLFIESKPFIEIGGLVVDENHRGRGIGKKLMEQVRQWCIEKEISEIRVRSHVKRKDAHKFYTNIGFTEIKEQKVFQMNL